MPAERFYFPGPLSTGQTCALEELEFHHLIHVMRTKTGDRVELVNGQGTLAQAQVVQIEKKRALLSIESSTSLPKPRREVILLQALPRIHRLDFIVEKGTELGMTALWLFPGERSERKELSTAQWERAKGQALAALKQCGRLWLPEIAWKPPLKKWSSLPFPTVFGDVHTDAPQLVPIQSSALVCIGPESGLTSQEEEKLKGMGAHGVKLHPHILRTDTAALAALTLLTI